MTSKNGLAASLVCINCYLYSSVQSTEALWSRILFHRNIVTRWLQNTAIFGTIFFLYQLKKVSEFSLSAVPSNEAGGKRERSCMLLFSYALHIFVRRQRNRLKTVLEHVWSRTFFQSSIVIAIPAIAKIPTSKNLIKTECLCDRRMQFGNRFSQHRQRAKQWMRRAIELSQRTVKVLVNGKGINMNCKMVGLLKITNPKVYKYEKNMNRNSCNLENFPVELVWFPP